MSADRLFAPVSLREIVMVLQEDLTVGRGHERELQDLINELGGIWAPGTAHAFLSVRRKNAVRAEAVDLLSLLIPHEDQLLRLSGKGR
jgi:hypothetical protein